MAILQGPGYPDMAILQGPEYYLAGPNNRVLSTTRQGLITGTGRRSSWVPGHVPGGVVPGSLASIYVQPDP